MASKGKERLLLLKQNPEMWAFSKEAFAVLVGIALEEAGYTRSPHLDAAAMCFGGKSQVSIEDLISPITRDWVNEVVEKALASIQMWE